MYKWAMRFNGFPMSHVSFDSLEDAKKSLRALKDKIASEGDYHFDKVEETYFVVIDRVTFRASSFDVCLVSR